MGWHGIQIRVDGRYEHISFRFRKRHPPPPYVGDRVWKEKKNIYVYILIIIYLLFKYLNPTTTGSMPIRKRRRKDKREGAKKRKGDQGTEGETPNPIPGI